MYCRPAPSATAATSSAAAAASQPLQGTVSTAPSMPEASHSMPSASTALTGNAALDVAGSLTVNAAVNAPATAAALQPLVEPEVVIPSTSAAAHVTRSSYINADLSPYQRQMQNLIGLSSFGYTSCSPDGNCAFNAVSQLMYDEQHPVRSFLDLTPESQNRNAELRQLVADRLRTDSLLQAVLCQEDNESDIHKIWPEVRSAHAADSAAPVWELLAQLVQPSTGTTLLCWRYFACSDVNQCQSASMNS